MEILFVLNSGIQTAGPSNHLFQTLIGKLLSEGWNVHVIEKQRKEQTADLDTSVTENENLTRHICSMENIDKGRLVKRYLDDVSYVLLCIRHYKKNRSVDVVFLQSCNIAFFHIFLMKRLIKKPILYNVQDIFPLNAAMAGMIRKNSLLYKGLRFLQRQAYRQADKIITISEDMKKSLTEEGIEAGKIQVIHNWSYSDDILDIAEEDNRFMIDEEIDGSRYKVIYAGNIGAVQNVDIVIKAAQLLKDAEGIHFYIIGDGVRKKELVEYAERNELNNVTFYPMQPSEYAPHIYSMADINVIPLAKGIIKTALPSKTAFCLSCGKPIIACVDTDSRFSQMLSACDKCHVVDSDDARGLAACILRFQESVKGRSAGGRELFKSTFSKEANASSYIETLKEMAKN